MYIIIGKEGCEKSKELKNIFDEKHIPYHYTDKENIDSSTMQYLGGLYPGSSPMVLKPEWQFINFSDMKKYYSEL